MSLALAYRVCVQVGITEVMVRSLDFYLGIQSLSVLVSLFVLPLLSFCRRHIATVFLCAFPLLIIDQTFANDSARRMGIPANKKTVLITG